VASVLLVPLSASTSYMTQRYRRRAERARNSQAIAKVLGVPQSVTQPIEKVVEG